MKLYLAIGSYFYAGGIVLGVFSNKEDAEKALQNVHNSFDEREVQEVDLDTCVEIYV